MDEEDFLIADVVAPAHHIVLFLHVLLLLLCLRSVKTTLLRG